MTFGDDNMKRSKQLISFLDHVKEQITSFYDADFMDINWCDSNGTNALHVAVTFNDFEIIKELIETGVEVNARAEYGVTPLHQALSAEEIEIRCIKLLVESGADIHALTEGDTPLRFAEYANNNEVYEYLNTAMKEYSKKDPAVWAKAQIAYLNNEIHRIEKQYGLVEIVEKETLSEQKSRSLFN